MSSPNFEAYNNNLRRVYLAAFVDDHLQAKDPWRRRITPTGSLICDKVRQEIRGKLQFAQRMALT